MKKQTLVLLAFTIALAGSAHAQLGRMGNPGFKSIMAKLFGDNTSFSADLEIQTAAPQNMSMPGTMAFDSGKSRFAMNFADAKGGQLPPGAADRLKAMGMDKTVAISRPDKKITYMIYPGMSAYIESPLQDPDADKPASAFKITSTEIGRENLDGHACVKNKVVITDDQGKSHESTVWNAVDLKKFPIKIESTEQNQTTTMLFSNIKLSKPDDALFEPPSDYKKYDSQQAFQQAMIARMRSMMMPTGHP